MVLKFLWPLRIAYLHNVTYTGKTTINLVSSASADALQFKKQGVNMREKKSGALSRVQKIKKRLSHSFGRLGMYQALVTAFG
ncbi:uncharacterized protein LOC124353734 isoform X5 [Homalodisca vitripennis]|uniref:uncharacterized protein LOC124353734 isoform X5 n=1 Tax=Homalodisca vitripennis TaxID=197043 RepID=UPI001EEC01CB|nr:uncharacterized protein LOC124353734 isoform X5 [Homalodisca vitripennis]